MNEKRQFTEFSTMLSPATGGIFTLEHSTLTYESIKAVKFCIYFAILAENSVMIRLQMVHHENGIMLINTSPKQLDDTINLSTVLVVGLKPREKLVNLRINSGDSYASATWTPSVWEIEPSRPTNTHRRCNEQMATVCHNCGRRHETENCEFPLYTIHCRGCLVASIDGSGHQKPCDPVNKVSFLRSNVLAEELITLFELTCDKSEVGAYYMHGNNFLEITQGFELLSQPAQSLLTVQNLPDNKIGLLMQQSSVKRCGVLIAVMDPAGKWFLRFRIVVTVAHGVLVFPIFHRRALRVTNGQFEIPGDCNNTIAVIGFKLKQPSFYAKLKVHANSNGIIDKDNFNGYTAYFGAESPLDNDFKLSIDDQLCPSASGKRFCSKIYKEEPVCESKRKNTSYR